VYSLIRLSPLFFVIVSTIGTIELSANLLLRKTSKPDPIYGFLREIFCIVLFYGIPSIILYSLNHRVHIIEFVITTSSGILLLLSFLTIEEKNYDHLILIALSVMLSGPIIYEYSIVVGIVASIILKYRPVKITNKKSTKQLWTKITTLRIPYILSIANLSVLLLILRGYI